MKRRVAVGRGLGRDAAPTARRRRRGGRSRMAPVDFETCANSGRRRSLAAPGRNAPPRHGLCCRPPSASEKAGRARRRRRRRAASTSLFGKGGRGSRLQRIHDHLTLSCRAAGNQGVLGAAAREGRVGHARSVDPRPWKRPHGASTRAAPRGGWPRALRRHRQGGARAAISGCRTLPRTRTRTRTRRGPRADSLERSR